MKTRSLRRFLAAFLCAIMFLCTPMAAFAEDLGDFSGDSYEFLSEDSEDLFIPSEEDEVSADEFEVTPEEEEILEEEEITEDPSDAGDILTEEVFEEDTLSEEALGNTEFSDPLVEVTEETASEPVTEEPLGPMYYPDPMLAPLIDAIETGKYGPYPFPWSYAFTNESSFKVSAVVDKIQQELFTKEGKTPVRIKSYKIVKQHTADFKDKNVATISKKGVLIAKNPGTVLVCAYDAKKKPVCCFMASASVYRLKTNVITQPLKDKSIVDYIEYVQENGKPLEEDFSSFKDYVISKSSNNKILSFGEDGKMTTGKSGSVTVTLKNSESRKQQLLGNDEEPVCNMKLKIKVKLPSVAETVKISPGKTKTIKVKNACKENQVVGVDVSGANLTASDVTQSGKYGEIIKIKASANGCFGMISIKMKNNMDYSCTLTPTIVFSIQTKKRFYDDVGKTGSYDTKTANALIKKVNAVRKKNGLPALKQTDSLKAQAHLLARGPEELGRKEFESKAAILEYLPDNTNDTEATTIAVAVFCDSDTGKYYLWSIIP